MVLIMGAYAERSVFDGSLPSFSFVHDSLRALRRAMR